MATRKKNTSTHEREAERRRRSQTARDSQQTESAQSAEALTSELDAEQAAPAQEVADVVTESFVEDTPAADVAAAVSPEPQDAQEAAPHAVDKQAETPAAQAVEDGASAAEGALKPSAATARRTWVRTEGVIVAPGRDPEDAEELLHAYGVVARLDWFPSTPHLIGLALLTDVQQRVAITQAHGGVKAGPKVSELVEELATRLKASVTIGPATFNALPAGDIDLSEMPEYDSSADRTVVVSPLPAYTVPLQATLMERPFSVASLPELGRRLIMSQGGGLELGAFGWEMEALPALVLSNIDGDLSVRAVISDDSEEDAIFSWSMTTRDVWGDVSTPGPALKKLADELLADVTDASVIAQVLPSADLEAIAHSLTLPGLDGVRALLEALQLPAWIADVLTGTIAPSEAPGAVIHEPRGLTNAVGRSVGMMLSDPHSPSQETYQGFVRLVTDKPWLIAGLNAVQGAAGLALIARARSRQRQTGRAQTSLWVAGALLLLDTAIDIPVTAWVRQRELRRRADEETLLVTRELASE